MNDQKNYDFVIYGASGFTGKLVVEYAIAKYLDSEDISWAIAGRNIDKLNEIKKELNISDQIEVLHVDR